MADWWHKSGREMRRLAAKKKKPSTSCDQQTTSPPPLHPRRVPRKVPPGGLVRNASGIPLTGGDWNDRFHKPSTRPLPISHDPQVPPGGLVAFFLSESRFYGLLITSPTGGTCGYSSPPGGTCVKGSPWAVSFVQTSSVTIFRRN